MKKLLGVLALILIGIAVGIFYNAKHRADPYELAAHRTLERFNAAIASKDHIKIADMFEGLISPAAHIKLTLHYDVFGMPSETPVLEQNFEKAGILRLVDITLYPLEDYRFTMALAGMRRDAMTGQLEIHLSGEGGAEEHSLFNGLSTGVHHDLSMDCNVYALPADNAETLRVTGGECALRLSSIPKEVHSGFLIDEPYAPRVASQSSAACNPKSCK